MINVALSKNIHHYLPGTFMLKWLFTLSFKCSNSDNIKVIQKIHFKSFVRQTANRITLMTPFAFFADLWFSEVSKVFSS